jgi:hypothetical protein
MAAADMFMSLDGGSGGAGWQRRTPSDYNLINDGKGWEVQAERGKGRQG